MNESRGHPYNISANYKRSHGVHTFELHNKKLAAVSAPTWEEYYELVQGLEKNIDIAISPELMTSPVRMEEVSNMEQQISERQEDIRRLSREHPKTIFILGSAIVESARKNSLLTFSAGREIARTDKEFLTPAERQTFTPGTAKIAKPSIEGKEIQLAICADLIPISHRDVMKQQPIFPYILSTTKTLLVSSCWGVPMWGGGSNEFGQDERYQGILERCATQVLNLYPNLSDIVMVDRAIPASCLEPYNVHFKQPTAN